MNKIICFIIFLLLQFLSQRLVFSEYKDMFAIGISVEESMIPTLRLKFKVYKNFSTEARMGVANIEKIDEEGMTLLQNVIYGIRSYYYANLIEKKLYKTYFGVEVDIVNSYLFSSTHFASGYVFGGYFGVEKYFSKKFSLLADVGPYYIYLKQKRFDISESGVDIVINFLLNYYFK